MRKDYYTEERLKEMGLNDRQIKAVIYIKEKGRITNKEYQELNNIKKRQTSEDFAVLEDKGILEKIGTTGKGTYYILKGQNDRTFSLYPSPSRENSSNISSLEGED